MNLILCGMMACGKTTVGRKLSDLTGRVWYDTDDLIVAKHGKIADIFANFGEPRFREIETETVKSLADQDDLVLSTGGGLVLKDENVVLLKQKGKIVYLRAQLDTLLGRLAQDTGRPLLRAEEGLSTRLTTLLSVREPVYGRVADFVVDVDNKSPEEIATEILETFCDK